MKAQHKKVRLTLEAVKCIQDDVRATDPKAEIFIFGSRADLSKKGGDIDILIISKIFDFKNECQLRNHLHNLIGEQQIDIVYSKNKTSDPFVKLALEKAVQL